MTDYIHPLFALIVVLVGLAVYAVLRRRETVRLRREELEASMRRHPSGKDLR